MGNIRGRQVEFGIRYSRRACSIRNSFWAGIGSNESLHLKLSYVPTSNDSCLRIFASSGARCISSSLSMVSSLNCDIKSVFPYSVMGAATVAVLISAMPTPWRVGAIMRDDGISAAVTTRAIPTKPQNTKNTTNELGLIHELDILFMKVRSPYTAAPDSRRYCVTSSARTGGT